MAVVPRSAALQLAAGVTDEAELMHLTASEELPPTPPRAEEAVPDAAEAADGEILRWEEMPRRSRSKAAHLPAPVPAIEVRHQWSGQNV
eukprot:SAG11_NODE_830_length_6956_cov_11.233484_4_plen_89_part_00